MRIKATEDDASHLLLGQDDRYAVRRVGDGMGRWLTTTRDHGDQKD
jgi:hypothetical protein